MSGTSSGLSIGAGASGAGTGGAGGGGANGGGAGGGGASGGGASGGGAGGGGETGGGETGGGAGSGGEGAGGAGTGSGGVIGAGSGGVFGVGGASGARRLTSVRHIAARADSQMPGLPRPRPALTRISLDLKVACQTFAAADRPGSDLARHMSQGRNSGRVRGHGCLHLSRKLPAGQSTACTHTNMVPHEKGCRVKRSTGLSIIFRAAEAQRTAPSLSIVHMVEPC